MKTEFIPNFSHHNGYRVLNADCARQTFKNLLFDWLDNQFSKIIQVRVMQVAFTKCGRFAVVISKIPVAFSFGIRLCTTNPYNQLSVYLLGISRTLESALLQSAKRVSLIEKTIDEFNNVVQHGDVVCVHHLAYTHMAVYDAERKVFYELIGYVETGKDALYHEILVAVKTVKRNLLKVLKITKYLANRCCILCGKRARFSEEVNQFNSITNNNDSLQSDTHNCSKSCAPNFKSGDDNFEIINDQNTSSFDKMDELNDPDYLATAEDQLIGLDNEYPISKVYASHSIAEVTATPENIFLTRNPLLKLSIKKYANSYLPEIVILRARSALGHSGWNPITRNCEHFVSWAKTGRVESYQVHNFGSIAAIFGATILQVSILLSLITIFLFAYLKSFPGIRKFIYSFENIIMVSTIYLFVIMSLIFVFGYSLSRYNGISGSFDRA